tara:strand:- start:2677 stop:3405 length:729 start_codon:yes stop_codon:yes gene_type:complete
MNTNTKEKKVAIMQPTFLPWLGYFALMENVDYFVFLDDVQLTKQSWQVRNKIRDAKGNTLWLTIPIKKHPLDTPINEIKVSNDKRLVKKIINSFEHCYYKCEFYSDACSLLTNHLSNDYLSDINISIIEDIKETIGIRTELFRSSELKIESKNRAERLVEIINNFDSKYYLSPVGAREYLEIEKTKKLFNDSKIQVEYLNYVHPKYNQIGKSFIENLGIIDCIANIGSEQTLEVVKSGLVLK